MTLDEAQQIVRDVAAASTGAINPNALEKAIRVIAIDETIKAMRRRGAGSFIA